MLIINFVHRRINAQKQGYVDGIQLAHNIEQCVLSVSTPPVTPISNSTFSLRYCRCVWLTCPFAPYSQQWKSHSVKINTDVVVLCIHFHWKTSYCAIAYKGTNNSTKQVFVGFTSSINWNYKCVFWHGYLYESNLASIVELPMQTGLRHQSEAPKWYSLLVYNL